MKYNYKRKYLVDKKYNHLLLGGWVHVTLHLRFFYVYKSFYTFNVRIVSVVVLVVAVKRRK